MHSAAQMELLLTLTPAQHAELTELVTELRLRLGTTSATLTMIEALRRAREAEDRPGRVR